MSSIAVSQQVVYGDQSSLHSNPIEANEGGLLAEYG
jgi:hypothetical protein